MVGGADATAAAVEITEAVTCTISKTISDENQIIQRFLDGGYHHSTPLSPGRPK
jgi:hypothetical protein